MFIAPPPGASAVPLPAGKDGPPRKRAMESCSKAGILSTSIPKCKEDSFRLRKKKYHFVRASGIPTQTICRKNLLKLCCAREGGLYFRTSASDHYHRHRQDRERERRRKVSLRPPPPPPPRSLAPLATMAAQDKVKVDRNSDDFFRT